MIEHGELIPLSFEYPDEEICVIRGHVTDDEATAAREHEYAGEGKRWGAWRHCYARFSLVTLYDAIMGRQQVLHRYDEPGRGRFPITMCEVAP